MTAAFRYAELSTPIGSFRIVFAGRVVESIDLLERGLEETGLPPDALPHRGPFGPGSPPAQLREYFAGRRQRFEVDIAPRAGSAFDRDVWSALREVPCGETLSYGELARRAGHPGAARAVGGAMHRNPIPIVVPCHRVVGDDRTLTGFGLGLWRKRWLLQHEGAWPLRDGTVEGPRDSAQRTFDDVELRRRIGVTGAVPSAAAP